MDREKKTPTAPRKIDQHYALKSKQFSGRAKTLLRKRGALRDAFLLQEILKRPYGV